MTHDQREPDDFWSGPPFERWEPPRCAKSLWGASVVVVGLVGLFVLLVWAIR